MKTMKYITSFCFIALLMVFGCDDDENIDFINNVAAPTNVSAGINVIPDNTGLTQITPTGDGVASYIVDFGDGSESSEALAPGEYTEHMYVEGTYEATITATGINGKSATGKQMVNVSFRAPENLEINTAIDASNPFLLNVSANADYASSFLVFFDTTNPDEEGTPLEVGGTVSMEYPGVGDYSIKVVALSGGTESSELEQMVTISAPVVFPIDFEVFDASAFIGFGGASAAVIDNPDKNGNISATVGEIVKGGPEDWAGNVITMSAPIDFSTRKLINMDVWSPRPGGKLTLKVENIDDSTIALEKEVTTVGNGAWEEVSFDLSDINTANTYQKLVLFFDFGTVGDASADWTFYIDNIKQKSADAGSGVTPITFEAGYEFSSFDGGAISVVSNPDTDGNPSSSVAEMIKGDGQVWAGSKITIEEPFELTATETITMKVWSPRAGLNLLMKFEDNVPWPDVSSTEEIAAITTTANTWEELSFTFPTIDTSIDWYNMVLIMDNGTVGDGSSNYTIYIDDISTTPMFNFEPKVALSSFDGGAISVVSNPDTVGNPSSMVAEMIKGDGQVWAGSKITAPEPFSVTSGSVVTAKVWSPRVGLDLLMKFEDDVPWPDVSGTEEKTATTTVANAWEVLTFTFSTVDAAKEWYNMVLIMENGTVGDGSSNYTIYLDDIDIN